MSKITTALVTYIIVFLKKSKLLLYNSVLLNIGRDYVPSIPTYTFDIAFLSFPILDIFHSSWHAFPIWNLSVDVENKKRKWTGRSLCSLVPLPAFHKAFRLWCVVPWCQNEQRLSWWGTNYWSCIRLAYQSYQLTHYNFTGLRSVLANNRHSSSPPTSSV